MSAVVADGLGERRYRGLPDRFTAVFHRRGPTGGGDRPQDRHGGHDGDGSGGKS